MAFSHQGLLFLSLFINYSAGSSVTNTLRVINKLRGTAPLHSRCQEKVKGTDNTMLLAEVGTVVAQWRTQGSGKSSWRRWYLSHILKDKEASAGRREEEGRAKQRAQPREVNKRGVSLRTPQRMAGWSRKGQGKWGERGHGEATGPKGTETLVVVLASTKGEGKWHPERRILEDSSPYGEEARGRGLHQMEEDQGVSPWTRHCPQHLTRS